MVYNNLHERYHFIERHVPMNKNQVINDWCVEQSLIMAYFKIVAVKSITGNSHKMHVMFVTQLSHRHDLPGKCLILLFNLHYIH